MFVIANGNAGGYNKAQSVGSPATAKNVIAVGALINGIQSWLFEGDASSLIALGMDADEVRRNAPMYSSNALADFSSRGPTADGRMKPTLCAPGAFVHSAMAGISDQTLYMMGTSQATPAIASLVALLRHRLIHTHKVAKPSSALVRGMFYHSAEALTSGVMHIVHSNLYRTSQTASPMSEMSQGFERADLTRLLKGGVKFKDRESVPSLGEASTYQFTATTVETVRIILSWTDYPGFYGQQPGRRVLVNDLDMRVLVWRSTQSLDEEPDLVLLAGSGTIHQLDRLNNQERIKFYVEAGDYVRVVVSGSGPFAFDRDQAYALLWSASLVEDTESEPIQCTP